MIILSFLSTGNGRENMQNTLNPGLPRGVSYLIGANFSSDWHIFDTYHLLLVRRE
jgi:hypothetical protein